MVWNSIKAKPDKTVMNSPRSGNSYDYAALHSPYINIKYSKSDVHGVLCR